MKKSFFILIAVMIGITGISYSQGSLTKGSIQVNAGLGLSGWGLPFYAGLDYGIHEDITLGGELSYRSYKENWKSYNYSHHIAGIVLNGNYHFAHLLKVSGEWDFYAGLSAGFFAWSSPGDYEGDHVSGTGLGAQLGGRYFFSDKVGVNLELGGSSVFSEGKLGITVKL